MQEILASCYGHLCQATDLQMLTVFAIFVGVVAVVIAVTKAGKWLRNRLK
ncbi:hypothetical protein [Mycolicibacterium hodleri]|nr:hypothetical protein [Mycolicibacterium hodleri]